MDLRLRAIIDRDLEMIMRWRTDPAVADFMYTDFVPSLERQLQWFDAICRDGGRMDWVICVDGIDVGLLSITRLDAVNLRGDWAYYLADPSVRGKGIGRSLELNVLRYVFEELGLHKLCCEVLGSNEKVVRIHEKYGSRVEGLRRGHVQKRGAFLDIVEMGILREEWERDVRGAHEFERAVFERATKIDTVQLFADRRGAA